MTVIDCDICQDLLPLVCDGIASASSTAAVRAHLDQCPHCRAMQDSLPQTPVPNPSAALRRAAGQLRTFLTLVLAFGVFFGLSLTAGSGVFYNVIIMPLVGALGYGIFRWRAAWIVPGILFLSHFLLNLLGMGQEHLNPVSLVTWTGIYATISLVGVVVAGLLHFVFRKEN